MEEQNYAGKCVTWSETKKYGWKQCGRPSRVWVKKVVSNYLEVYANPEYCLKHGKEMGWKEGYNEG